jgi:hypothetical protein
MYYHPVPILRRMFFLKYTRYFQAAERALSHRETGRAAAWRGAHIDRIRPCPRGSLGKFSKATSAVKHQRLSAPRASLRPCCEACTPFERPIPDLSRLCVGVQALVRPSPCLVKTSRRLRTPALRPQISIVPPPSNSTHHRPTGLASLLPKSRAIALHRHCHRLLGVAGLPDRHTTLCNHRGRRRGPKGRQTRRETPQRCCKGETTPEPALGPTIQALRPLPRRYDGNGS